MTRFKVCSAGVRLLTNRIVRTIRNFFCKFWTKLTENQDDEQELVECSKSKPINKFSELNQVKSMKRTRRRSSFTHLKYFKIDQDVEKVIKNDYYHKTTSHRISGICKSFFSTSDA
jgi:hypothetical protein